jgi:hypothetical protein
LGNELKKLEIKIGLTVKKLPLDEYESIMKLWKRYALKFERDLRQLADSGVISFKILDDFTKKFKFDELHRLRFTTPEEPEITAQRPGVPAIGPASQAAPQYYGQQPTQPAPQPQTAPQQQPAFGQTPAYQQPASYQRPQAQPPAQPSAQPQAGFQQPSSTFGGTPATSRRATASRQSDFQQESSGFQPFTSRPETQPSGYATPSQPRGFQQPAPEPTSRGLSPFSDLSQQPTSPQPGAQPTPEPSTSPSFSFNVPGLSSQPAPSTESGISLGVDEEDRATGIAILRKKMLTELRKIRSVVEQDQDDTF